MEITEATFQGYDISVDLLDGVDVFTCSRGGRSLLLRELLKVDKDHHRVVAVERSGRHEGRDR